MSLPPSPKSPGDGEPDPSMDDILASIRRILDDDQAVKEPGADVLMLDTSMMVENGSGAGSAVDAGASERAPTISSGTAASPHDESARADHTIDAAAPHAVEPVQAEPVAPSPGVALNERNTMASPDDDPAALSTMPRPPASLVAPAAAAATVNSVGALMRTLAAERSVVVSRGGTTIEDIVREEMKPFLKEWLDTHLPPIVERLVQVEIERLVARQSG